MIQLPSLHRFRTACVAGAALATGALFLVGCGGPPATNPMLTEAQADYERAASDSSIVANAPVALEEAEETLVAGRRLLREGADPEAVTHQAYLAQQRVRIAQELAKLNAAEQAVTRAEAERQEVVISARRQEAEQAQREAQRAQREAERAQREAAEERERANQARGEAEAAISRAEQLAREIEELQAQQTERGLVLTLGDVLFDVNQAALKPGGQRAVERLVSFLNDYPRRRVLIEGFTDATGPEDYNLQLSQRRTEAVRDALQAQGIAADRVRTRGYGEAFPVASNDNPTGRQRNRRVEVIISDRDGAIPDRSE